MNTLKIVGLALMLTGTVAAKADGSVLYGMAGVYSVAKTGHNTFTNTCGDARCQVLVVYLPLGAQIQQVQCLSNIDWGRAGDLPHGQLKLAECGKDGAWAIFDPIVIETTPTNTIVRSTFHNRSSDWDRDVELLVRYTIG